MDKDTLLKPRLAEQTYEIEGVGTVRFRALSRAQVLAWRADPTNDGALTERRVLAAALIDPVLTEDEVGEWQEVSPAGELEELFVTVAGLSGLFDSDVKGKMQQFPDGSGDELHVLPGE